MIAPSFETRLRRVRIVADDSSALLSLTSTSDNYASLYIMSVTAYSLYVRDRLCSIQCGYGWGSLLYMSEPVQFN